jgi:hypothetical protein
MNFRTRISHVGCAIGLLVGLALTGSRAHAASATLAFESPRGGEVFLIGLRYEVRVTSRSKSVQIDLSRDGGATYTALATIDNTAKDRTRNTAAFTVTGPASSNCVMRATAAGGKEPVSVISMPFSIGASSGGGSAPTGPVSSGAASSNFVLTADGLGNSHWATVGTNGLSDGAVSNLKLATGAVTTDKIVDGAVSNPKLATGAVTAEKMLDGTVTALKLASGSVTTDKILDGAVTNPKLATGAVTSDKILDGTLTSAKLATGAVTTDKIADGSVTSAKLAPGGVAWNLSGNTGTNPATHYLGTTDAADLVLRRNASEAVRIASGGSVGIGTSTPGSKLDVAGPFTLSATNGETAYHTGLQRLSDHTDIFWFGGGIGGLHFKSGAVAEPGVRMVITQDAKVGIGTHLPGKQLHIVSPDGGAIRLDRTNSTARQWDINIKPTGFFTIGDNTAVQDRVSIDLSGRVGIGTITPSQLLDVAGNVQVGGNLNVTGTLTKGAGTFKIDHPLDPENKYLSHSFVESPDMKNFYDGTVVLNSDGEASVELPEWFEALNRTFCYQLTAVGAPAPALFVKSEIADNRFKIAGGSPGLKVCWTVTGVRKDAYAKKHPTPVEEAKPAHERGRYLHPEAFGKPASLQIANARAVN